MDTRNLSLGAAAILTGLALILPVGAPAQLAPASDREQTTDADGGTMPADADVAAAGAALFAERCTGCHSADPGQPSYGGPGLAGVVGRPAASAKFRYSSALRSSGLTWTVEELDAYLASPMTKVPGTSMVISLPDARQRAALIAFLATRPASE